MSSLVYEDSSEIKIVSKKLGLTAKIVEAKGKIFGHKYDMYRAVIFSNKTDVFLVFRGTNNVSETLTDLAASKNLQGIHLGFKLALTTLVEKGKLYEKVDLESYYE